MKTDFNAFSDIYMSLIYPIVWITMRSTKLDHDISIIMKMSPTSMMMTVAIALTMLQTSYYLDWLANGVNHSHPDFAHHYDTNIYDDDSNNDNDNDYVTDPDFAHHYDINIHGDDSNNYVTDQRRLGLVGEWCEPQPPEPCTSL